MITLKTLPQATAQEVFDQIAVHLLTQNKKSIDGDTLRCLYKTKDGLKCAAGCLISDEEYCGEFEGLDWFRMMELKIVPENHKRLITLLQTMHDNPDTEPSEWKTELISISRIEKLNTTAIEKFL